MNNYDETRRQHIAIEVRRWPVESICGACAERFPCQTITLLDENAALRAAVLGLLNCETHSNHAPCRPCSLCESTLRKALGDAS